MTGSVRVLTARLLTARLLPVGLFPVGLLTGLLAVRPVRGDGAVRVGAGRSPAPGASGCLRNAAAVGRWAAARVPPAPDTARAGPDGAPARGGRDQQGLPGRPPRALVVVAAGEQWPDGSLRPCAEDLWGAGAVLAVLAAVVDTWPGAALSPEAGVALAAYEAVAGDLTAALEGCASGRELRGSGFAADVVLAGQVNVSRCVPVLDESRAFRDIALPRTCGGAGVRGSGEQAASGAPPASASVIRSLP